MPKREYVLTNGTKFIKQDADGKYKQTTSIGLADSWDSGKVAESVLVNSVPKILGGKFYVAYINDDGDLVKYTLSPEEKRIRKAEILSNQEDKSFELCQYSFDSDEDVQRIILGFEDVRDILKSNLDKFRVLEKKLCRLDYIGEDLTHCRGRKIFNARDGYKLNSAAQKLFLKRVSVKNQMEIVKTMNAHYSGIMSHIEDICNTIDDVRHRTYKPRVLVKLFEDSYVDLDYIGSLMFESEIPKYKKKKNSSISDSRAKSKHKHEYKDCLLVADNKPLKATYCKICGKIGNVNFFDFVRTESGYHRMLRPDEIYRKYRKLEIIYVKDHYQKYIPITGGQDET